jgi:phosphatidylglycerol:prolipoprotein diacylglycerol transferase
MFLNFITWDPRPEMFTIPGIDWPVRWYGLLWALALLASHFVMNRIYKTEGRTNKQLDTLTLYVILGTIIGARLGHCLFYGPLWDVYDGAGNLIEEGYLAHPLNLLKVYEGGLASHGGAIGILIGTWLYCRKEKESIWWIFDRLMVVVPLASMLIRLGNLMNSEIIGKKTNMAFGFIFVQIDNVPRHPAQLYEAICYFFLFILMYWLWKNKRAVLGQGFMFGLLLTCMFIIRFLIEFIKENQVAFEDHLVLNNGQSLSIPFILAGLYLMWRSKKHLPSLENK